MMDSDPDMVMCPACMGRGENRIGESCETCGGEGGLEPDPEFQSLDLLGPDVSMCCTCGAVVVGVALHAQWHAERSNVAVQDLGHACITWPCHCLDPQSTGAVYGYWHKAKGCNHYAREIGDECGNPDEGEWAPLVKAVRVPVGNIRSSRQS